MTFLTPPEVQLLTGYRKPKKQIGWLQRHAIPHYVNRAGYPVVPTDMLEKRTLAEPLLGVVR